MILMSSKIDFDCIDIVYENCDFVRIPAELITHFTVGNLSQTLNSYQPEKAEFSYECDFIQIELLAEVGNLTIEMSEKYHLIYSTPFVEHVQKTPSTTHIDIRKDDKSLFYVSVPYTDISGMSYHNYYEKIVRDKWYGNLVYTINKRNLRGIALWKFLKMELHLLPHNYYLRRIKVRFENFWYDLKKRHVKTTESKP